MDTFTLPKTVCISEKSIKPLGCRFERGIEKMLEDACEKDGWICAVAISQDGVASLFVEKFGGCPIAASDEKEAFSRCLSFIKEEFGATPNAKSGGYRVRHGYHSKLPQ